MNETFQGVRRRILDRQLLATVVIACLLCTGGWMSYTAYVEPGERTEQREYDLLTVTGDVSHGATIVEPNPIYGPDNGGDSRYETEAVSNETATNTTGEVTDTNGDVSATGSEITTVTDKPLYYTAIAPEAHGDVAVRYDTPASDGMAITVELERVSRAVEDGVVYWEESEQLARVDRADVTPGEAVVAPFELNVSAIGNRIGEIEDSLGATPGDTETYISVDVAIEGVAEGESVSLTRTFRIDLVREEAIYRIDSSEPIEASLTGTETSVVTRSYGPLWTVGGPLSALAGVFGTGLFFIVRLIGSPTPAERAWLEYRSDRKEFESIIVRAALPPKRYRPAARVPTLAELAQLAIDNDTAVIEEPNENRYVVQHGGIRYIYQPPCDPGISG
ncbi:DUF5305 domain-containing protein [Natronomonas sp. LN261]|jgi:hypothetical protein|uniref:DUF5305 domain-containing protein n=1 Tax=Natronomonas sp. LN261 TaxID=2750669 RepID=UPI0015EF43F7|nr:DUF5305 domain-containing protein [Natronomonas sp. LN261]